MRDSARATSVLVVIGPQLTMLPLPSERATLGIREPSGLAADPDE